MIEPLMSIFQNADWATIWGSAQLRSYYCDCDGAPPTISSKERGAAAIAGCEGLGVSKSNARFLQELKSATKAD